MSETGKGVTVTVTPAGRVRDIAVDGHSIARVVPRGGVDLRIEAGMPPVLSFALVADEIIVKADEA